MKIDVFKYLEKIPNDFIKNRVADGVFNVFIPFNLLLGMKIKMLSPDKCEVASYGAWKTKNHVGGAHACFLALMGEYPAGLLLAQIYSPENYRMIISELHMEYMKQGRGFVKSVARRPMQPPEFCEGEAFVPMVTDIFNKKGELIATAKTKWQLKEWSQVRSPKS
jgi:acyl-coenzyme A thioesterase PaaI-like protein